MADSFVQLPPDSTGKLLDTAAVTVGANTVQRERHVIADNVSNNYASISAAGAVKVDGSAVTQPVSAASLPLPTGASTDATVANPQVTAGTTSAPTKIDIVGGKTTDVTPQYQPIPLTNAGAAVKVDGSATTQPVSGSVTVSGTVTSNIGTTNGLALDATVSGLQVTQGSTTAGQKGDLVQGAVTTAVPSYTNGQTSPLSLNTAGGLRVDLVDGSGHSANIDPSGNLNFDLQQVGGAAVALGQTTMAASLPVAIASNQSAVPVSQSTAAATTAGWPVVDGTVAEATAAWTSATAGNTALQQNVLGYSSVIVTFNQGTTITGGVVTFEASDTTGFTNAYPIQVVATDSFTAALTYTLQQSTNKAFEVDVSGFAAFRVRLSTVISGTGTVNVGIQSNAMAADPAVTVGGTVAATQSGSWTVTTTPPANASTNIAQVNGSTVATAAAGALLVGIEGHAGATLDATVSAGTAPTNGISTLVQYNSTVPALTAAQTVSMQSDTAGSTYVNVEGRKATYSCFASFTPVAGDIAVLPGSASKTIRVTRVEVSLSTTGTAAVEAVQLVKRSAADTAGTSAAMTTVPHDSNFAAASAAPLSYTAAPTPGAAVGTIRGVQFNDGSSALPGNQTWLWTFGERPASAIVLRGTAQELCVNLGAVVATQTATVSFEWTEE